MGKRIRTMCRFAVQGLYKSRNAPWVKELGLTTKRGRSSSVKSCLKRPAAARDTDNASGSDDDDDEKATSTQRAGKKGSEKRVSFADQSKGTKDADTEAEDEEEEQGDQEAEEEEEQDDQEGEEEEEANETKDKVDGSDSGKLFCGFDPELGKAYRRTSKGKKEFSVELAPGKTPESAAMATWPDGTKSAVPHLTTKDLALLRGARSAPSSKTRIGEKDGKPVSVYVKKDRKKLIIMEMGRRQICQIRVDKFKKNENPAEAALSFMTKLAFRLVAGEFTIAELYKKRNEELRHATGASSPAKAKPASRKRPAAAAASSPAKAKPASRKLAKAAASSPAKAKPKGAATSPAKAKPKGVSYKASKKHAAKKLGKAAKNVQADVVTSPKKGMKGFLDLPGPGATYGEMVDIQLLCKI